MLSERDKAQEIVLTEVEKRIFDFLLKANEYKLKSSCNTIRVAGGWVRDKLLGKKNDDIDIVLDKNSGREFAEIVVKYAQRQTEDVVGTLGVVKANPDQSKHLETAVLPIYGLSIDFAQLRTETYGHTRIPTIEIGTPVSDAYRRDLTINSLYYNINKNKIEDFTGRGLDDLRDHKLDTPLDPEDTFHDDPLRILRVLRFQSRFPDFQIENNVQQAFYSDALKEMLNSKVSKERVGKELMGLMKGEDPTKALFILFDTGIVQSIFNLPEEEFHDWRMDQKNKHHTQDVLMHILGVVQNTNEMLLKQNIDPELRAMANWAALLHDIGKLKKGVMKIKKTDEGETSTFYGHENVGADIAKDILTDLHYSNDIVKNITTLVQEHMRLTHVKDFSNKAVRKYKRELGELGDILITLSIADSLAHGTEESVGHADEKEIFRQRVLDQPDDVITMKPLVDGNELMNMYPTLNPRTGWIREVGDYLIDLQLAEEISTKEEALEAVKTFVDQNYSGFQIKASVHSKKDTKKQKVPNPFRRNLDYGEGFYMNLDDHESVQEYREKKKKQLSRRN